MAGKWLRVGTLAALDQAWLSAVNFAVSLAFIRWGEKTEYGMYLLLLTPIYLLQGIQNALFLSPFATLFQARPPEQREPVLQVLIWGQVAYTVLVAILGFISLVVYQLTTEGRVNLAIAAAFSLATVGLIAREAMRSAQYVQGHAGRALVGDLIFGVVLLGVTLASVISGSVAAVWILVATGVAGLLPLLRTAFTSSRQAISLPKAERQEFWRCGRWALIGAGLTWVNLNAYPYVAAAAFGVAAVAEINAARLFMMPIVLCLPAWSNLVRPKFARWIAEKKPGRLRNVSIHSAMIGVAALVTYVAVLVVAYPWLEGYLGPGYLGLLPSVLAWSVFFLFSLLRAVFMAILMVDEAGYKKLSLVSVLSLFLLVPVMGAAIQFNTVWVVGGLALIELVQMLVIGKIALTYWRRTAS